jgi:hypothetical protein
MTAMGRLLLATVPLAAAVLLSPPAVVAGQRTLVPSAALKDPASYWTTWYVQNYVGCARAGRAAGCVAGKKALGDEQLFGSGGSEGWANFFPAARSDLKLVLDELWFAEPWDYGSQWQLDELRFQEECNRSSCNATGQWQAAAKALMDRTHSSGWAGLGLWHHGLLGIEDSSFGQQLADLAGAGVSFLKIDGTDLAGNITAVAAEATHSKLRIEHKQGGTPPLNGNWSLDGRAESGYIEQLANLLAVTDVLRTNDIVCQMSVPTCLDRMARTLAVSAARNASAPAVPGARAVVAPQDEAYMAAGLSGALAAMRHPLPQIPGDTQLNGNRQLSKRMDEITRAVRWFRIAPPAGAFDYPSAADAQVVVDPVPLTDVMTLSQNDTWYKHVWGTLVRQGAPARTVRGLAYLPEVVPADPAFPGVTPFVVASKHPNGALAVAALGRTLDIYDGWIMPRANITLWAGAKGPGATIGIFGAFGALTLVWDDHLDDDTTAGGMLMGDGDDNGEAVWMQDLAADSAMNVSGQVAWCNAGNGRRALYIPGGLIDKVGKSGRSSPADISDPGVVVKLLPTSTNSRSAVARAAAAAVERPACPAIPANPPVLPPP